MKLMRPASSVKSIKEGSNILISVIHCVYIVRPSQQIYGVDPATWVRFPAGTGPASWVRFPPGTGKRPGFDSRLGQVQWAGFDSRLGQVKCCPNWESYPSRWIYRQTLYHVAVKAGFYRRAVEIYHVYHVTFRPYLANLCLTSKSDLNVLLYINII